jgi:hypothetical protein
MVLFYTSIPVLHPNYFTVFQLSFTEKSWVYALGIQIFFNQGIASILAALSGILFSGLYFSTPLARLTWPKSIRRLGRRYVLPIIDFSIFSSSGGLRRANAGGENDNTFRGNNVQRNQYRVQRDLDEDSQDEAEARVVGGSAVGRGAGVQAAALPQADPEAVARLVAALGMSRDEVEDALRRSFNDENVAANRLLGM